MQQQAVQATRGLLAVMMRKGRVNWKHSSKYMSSWAQQKGKGVSHRYLQAVGKQEGIVWQQGQG